ncbi:MAG: hypothetical protein EB101_05645 [Chitinophagia bacterium]|nr:hypothetical protein [Chitinophagia bacterium]
MKWLNRKFRGTSNYRSQFEAQLALQLEKAGVKFGYESVKIKYVKQCTYKPDFVVPRRRPLILEAKGYFTSADRSKLMAILKQNPWIDLRIVFQRAKQRLSKKSSTTYGEWATAQKIEWAEGKIPEEWLKNEQHTGST